MLFEPAESGLIKEDVSFPLGVASAPRSLSGNSTSPFSCRALAAASAALIASASAADASTRYSTPLAVRLFKVLQMNEAKQVILNTLPNENENNYLTEVPEAWHFQC